MTYDVIVVGGGTAGVVAAIQAGRAGARTLLVEKNGMPGGTLTVGGVNYPGLFHAWTQQVIAGIGWELVTRCVAESGDTLPDFSQQHATDHWKEQVRVNVALYAALCEETLLEAGVELLYHTMVGRVQQHWEGTELALCTKSGLRSVQTRTLIDCTGDANVVALAGYPVHRPAAPQPGTLVCQLSGYDAVALDWAALRKAYHAAVRRGELAYTDTGWDAARFTGKWIVGYGGSSNHLHGINAHDSEGKTRLEIAARRALLRAVRFLRRQPGLENLRVDWVAVECGVRETATIAGKATVTAEDYVSGVVWQDAVCYAFYPIDLHQAERAGLDCRPLKEGVVPTIPRGALLPAGSRNLLVAGRCLSSDRLANSALRVQAACMAMGQAAGAMAALAADSGVEVEALPMTAIRQLLHEHGAIVPQPAR
jgi:glycine/D-amino acid oxidase-like deaminating enzyme